MLINNYYNHLKNILKHKYYVCKYCFKCGLYYRGITHDLSKLSYNEFIGYANNYTKGTSPVATAKAKYGYFMPWLLHKGKNKHHWEFWTDFYNGEIVPIKIPYEDVIEMVIDMYSASLTYSKGIFDKNAFITFYNKNKKTMVLHEETSHILDLLIDKLLRDGINDFCKVIKNI
jgi:hypothetical protein